MKISLLKKRGCLKQPSQSLTIAWRSVLTGNAKSISILPRLDGERSYALLQYTKTQPDGMRMEFEYPVNLVKTPCFFGGHRFWFACPLLRDGLPCEKRVGVLYMGERYFGCRECLDLAYESQQETHTEFFKILRIAFPKPSPTLRIKYWKGQTTKRYRSFLKQTHFQEQIA